MSPIVSSRGQKITIPNSLYTVVLAVALGLVLATSAFVVFKCYSQYQTIFGTP